MNNGNSEIIIYQTEDGRTRIDCRFDAETIWLTQAQMAELFGTTPQNVTLHLKAIYGDSELSETATCKDYLQVRIEGKRRVSRNLSHYSTVGWVERSETHLISKKSRCCNDGFRQGSTHPTRCLRFADGELEPEATVKEYLTVGEKAYLDSLREMQKKLKVGGGGNE